VSIRPRSPTAASSDLTACVREAASEDNIASRCVLGTSDAESAMARFARRLVWRMWDESTLELMFLGAMLDVRRIS
jgi:hypothetical protein